MAVISCAVSPAPPPFPLQKMIQRILRVEYEIPPHVRASPECRDLLSRILVAGVCGSVRGWV